MNSIQCNIKEDDVVKTRSRDDREGSFPIYQEPAPLAKVNNYNTSILSESGHYVETAEESDQSVHGLTPGSLTPGTGQDSPAKPSRWHSLQHPWSKLSDEHSTVGLESTPTRAKGLAVIHRFRPKLLEKRKSSKNAKLGTLPPMDPQILDPPQPISRPSLEGTASTEDLDAYKPLDASLSFEVPEEEVVFTSEGPELVLKEEPLGETKEQEIINSPKVEYRVCEETGKLNKFVFSPPVLEIEQERNRVASDLSDVSSLLSSLSGSKNNALEFGLETGFGGMAQRLMAVSENIVRTMERKENREKERASNPGTCRKFARCLVLLMDPRKKIFEIVQVPYQPAISTVGDMLDQLPNLATDRRLAKLHYTGLTYEGVHVCAPLVPVDIMLSSQDSGKPLFAVPESFTSGQIEVLGNYLLSTPGVAQLVSEQLALVECTNPKRNVIDSPIKEIVTHSKVASPRQGQPGSAHRLSTSNATGRLLKSTALRD